MYKCQYCTITTNWISSLRIHEKRMHKRLFREKIEYHSKIDSKNDIVQSDNEYQGKSESKSEIKKMYTCEDCTFSTNWPTSLRRHEKLKHNPCENNQMCKCPSCTFVTSWLAKHEKFMQNPSLTEYDYNVNVTALKNSIKEELNVYQRKLELGREIKQIVQELNAPTASLDKEKMEALELFENHGQVKEIEAVEWRP